MKIVLVNNYYYLRGGSEQVFFDEIRLLEDYGHKVFPFSRHHKENFPNKYAAFYSPDIQTDRMIASLQSLKTLKEIIYSQTNKKNFENFLNHFKPHVIHAHNIYGRITTSVLDIAKRYNLPVIMTLHDYKLICPCYKLMRNGKVCEDCRGRRFYMAVLNRCHKDSYCASLVYTTESAFNEFFGKYRKNVNFFIAPSRFLQNKLIEFEVDARKIVYIPNFINLDEYEPNYNFDPYLLYFGRVSEEKGINVLVDAFDALRPKGIELFIVGDGPLKAGMESKVEKLDSQNIKFTGYLTGNALKQIIQNAIAVILPSQCYENAPMSVLEAFAYGKPVIGSNIGGIAEIIDDGINGYLFEVGNPVDLAGKIELLLSKRKKDLAQMGMLARKKVEEKYNAEVHYHKLISLYNKVFCEKGNRDEESEGRGDLKSL